LKGLNGRRAHAFERGSHLGLKLGFIERLHFAAIKQGSASDYRVDYVARLCAEDYSRLGVVHGRVMSSRKINGNQVRLLARLKRPDLSIKPDGARRFDGRES
jgi:hypothetical protein